MKYLTITIFIIIFIIILLFSLSDYLHYRLGDVIGYENYNKSKLTRFWYKFYYKNSIATEYLSKTEKIYDFDILHQIVKNRSSKLKNIPGDEDLVIHLRIGDVIEKEYTGSIDDLLEGKSYYCYLISYKDIENALKKLKDKKLNIKKIIIVGGYHIHGNHDRSNTYINKIKDFLRNKNYNVVKRINTDEPDEDFLWLANSKNFLRSGGGFSNLVNKMVEMNKKNNLRESNFKEEICVYE